MGREIRMVPANWEHPKKQQHWGIDFVPMYNESFERTAAEWQNGYELWAEGKHPDQLESPDTTKCSFEDWHGEEPDREYYLPYDPKDNTLCTWYQVYETVSEGTPVSPAFATQDELVSYLVDNGDFWDQQRTKETGAKPQGYSREAAEQFVKSGGWAPSFVMTVSQEGASMESGVEAMARLA